MKLNHVIAVVCLLLAAWLYTEGGGAILSSSPVPGDRLNVLIVEDASNRPGIPQSQVIAMMSQAIDEYVSEKHGRLWVFDQGQIIDERNDEWLRRAWEVNRPTLPYLIIDNKGRGTAEPLPQTAEELLARIKEFAE